MSTKTTRIYNFHKLNTGAIVQRSPHWKLNRNDKLSKQIGIVTENQFFADANGHVICWPVIHWEGEVCSTIVHPVNAVPYRDEWNSEIFFTTMVE